MVKVSHEVPKLLLETSRFFNDYDYALVNICERDSHYENFFHRSLEMGREVILDNSLHELGEAISGEEYIKWIEKLKPTYYVVPDTYNDTLKNIDMFEEWVELVGERQLGKRIVVMHGWIYQDYADHYKWMDKVLGDDEIIAFTAGDDWTSKNDGYRRYDTIFQLHKMEVINPKRKHHLLGCIVPQEFKLYKDMKFIHSLDTSSPVTAAYECRRISWEGLKQKPRTRINELFDWCEHIDLNLLYENIARIKSFLG